MKFAVSQNPADVEGIWKNYSDGVAFKVARSGNTTYLKAVDKAEAPYRKQIARNKLSTEKGLEVHCRAMAEGLLKGWKGVEDEGGELEFNTDNAYLVLRHNPDVREFVFEVAVEQENFRNEDVETTAKKSRSS
jgi:hypothetical protein